MRRAARRVPLAIGAHAARLRPARARTARASGVGTRAVQRALPPLRQSFAMATRWRAIVEAGARAFALVGRTRARPTPRSRPPRARSRPNASSPGSRRGAAPASRPRTLGDAPHRRDVDAPRPRRLHRTWTAAWTSSAARGFAASSASQNHHQVLGVRPGASPEELKKAYRREAIKWHPDRHPDGPAKVAAEAKFKRVSEAYQALLPRRRPSGYSGASSNRGSSHIVLVAIVPRGMDAHRRRR